MGVEEDDEAIIIKTTDIHLPAGLAPP